MHSALEGITKDKKYDTNKNMMYEEINLSILPHFSEYLWKKNTFRYFFYMAVGHLNYMTECLVMEYVLL